MELRVVRVTLARMALKELKAIKDRLGLMG